MKRGRPDMEKTGLLCVLLLCGAVSCYEKVNYRNYDELPAEMRSVLEDLSENGKEFCWDLWGIWEESTDAPTHFDHFIDRIKNRTKEDTPTYTLVRTTPPPPPPSPQTQKPTQAPRMTTERPVVVQVNVPRNQKPQSENQVRHTPARNRTNVKLAQPTQTAPAYTYPQPAPVQYPAAPYPYPPPAQPYPYPYPPPPPPAYPAAPYPYPPVAYPGYPTYVLPAQPQTPNGSKPRRPGAKPGAQKKQVPGTNQTKPADKPKPVSTGEAVKTLIEAGKKLFGKSKPKTPQNANIKSLSRTTMTNKNKAKSGFKQLVDAGKKGWKAYQTAKKNQKNKAQAKRKSRSLNPYAYSTSCGERICASIYDYPTQKIKRVVHKLFEIYNGDEWFAHTEKQRLRPEVESFARQWYNGQFVDLPNPGGPGESSRTIEDIIYPTEISAIEDSKAYYVVDVQEFRQSIVSIKCISRRCSQRRRVRALLVLPTDKSEYWLEDLQIKSVEINNGCFCDSSY